MTGSLTHQGPHPFVVRACGHSTDVRDPKATAGGTNKHERRGETTRPARHTKQARVLLRDPLHAPWAARARRTASALLSFGCPRCSNISPVRHTLPGAESHAPPPWTTATCGRTWSSSLRRMWPRSGWVACFGLMGFERPEGASLAHAGGQAHNSRWHAPLPLRCPPPVPCSVSAPRTRRGTTSCASSTAGSRCTRRTSLARCAL